MDHGMETEVAAVATGSGFLAWRRRHAMPPGAACFNCGTRLQGPWCHACGQLGEDYHRSAVHLIGEACEGLFHADGRLARTLPRLLLRPAALTRDYLAGRRAPQVPPLRLFLVVLLIVFLAGEAASEHDGVHFVNVQVSPKDRAELAAGKIDEAVPWKKALEIWLRERAVRAADHPEQFTTAMASWAHDFAFLTLPLSGLILGLMFAFRRGFVLFDHLVFSMHSLSFLGLLFTAALILHAVLGAPAWWLLAASPVHLYAHMRGVYRTGWFGTLLRMGVLFILSAAGFTALMLALVIVGLGALKG